MNEYWAEEYEAATALMDAHIAGRQTIKTILADPDHERALRLSHLVAIEHELIRLARIQLDARILCAVSTQQPTAIRDDNCNGVRHLSPVLGFQRVAD